MIRRARAPDFAWREAVAVFAILNLLAVMLYLAS